MKIAAALPAMAALTVAGAWGFSRAFDPASFLGGVGVGAVLLAGMTAMILWTGMGRRAALALGLLVWLGVVFGGLHLAAQRAVEEVARFVRERPESNGFAAEKGESLSDPEIWRRFLADNGLAATGPDIRSYLRLRKAQGIWVKDRHRKRELRGVWLELAWLQIVLLAGAGAMGAAWLAAALDE